MKVNSVGGIVEPPLEKLEYLYISTASFERDLTYYRDVEVAKVEWAFFLMQLERICFAIREMQRRRVQHEITADFEG